MHRGGSRREPPFFLVRSLSGSAPERERVAIDHATTGLRERADRAQAKPIRAAARVDRDVELARASGPGDGDATQRGLVEVCLIESERGVGPEIDDDPARPRGLIAVLI